MQKETPIEIVVTEQAQEFKNLYDSIKTIKSDLEKIKEKSVDKFVRSVISQLEDTVRTHTKSIDNISKKMFELQTNLTSYVQQPISHTLIETIRKQLTDEILANTKEIIDARSSEILHIVDEKIDETRKQINNTKKFMFYK